MELNSKSIEEASLVLDRVIKRAVQCSDFQYLREFSALLSRRYEEIERNLPETVDYNGLLRMCVLILEDHKEEPGLDILYGLVKYGKVSFVNSKSFMAAVSYNKRLRSLLLLLGRRLITVIEVAKSLDRDPTSDLLFLLRHEALHVLQRHLGETVLEKSATVQKKKETLKPKAYDSYLNYLYDGFINTTLLERETPYNLCPLIAFIGVYGNYRKLEAPEPANPIVVYTSRYNTIEVREAWINALNSSQYAWFFSPLKDVRTLDEVIRECAKPPERTEPETASDADLKHLFGEPEPGAGDPEPGDPEPGDPEPGDSGAGEPGAGEPGAGEPGAGEPGAGEPGAGEPGAGVGESGAGEPEAWSRTVDEGDTIIDPSGHSTIDPKDLVDISSEAASRVISTPENTNLEGSSTLLDPGYIKKLASIKVTSTEVRKLLQRMIPYATQVSTEYRSDIPSRKLPGQFGREVDVESTPSMCIALDVSGSINKPLMIRALLILVTEIANVWDGRIEFTLITFATRTHMQKAVWTTAKAVKQNGRKVITKVVNHDVGGSTEVSKVFDKYSRVIRASDIFLIITDFEFWKFESRLASLARKPSSFAILLAYDKKGVLEKYRYNRRLVNIKQVR